jgi:hypothetical protein
MPLPSRVIRDESSGLRNLSILPNNRKSSIDHKGHRAEFAVSGNGRHCAAVPLAVTAVTARGSLAHNLERRSALNACSEFSDGRCGSSMQCNRENWDKPIDPDLLRMIPCPNAW